jgi:hypothetical protein
MNDIFILAEGVFRPLHMLEVGRIYRVLGIQPTDRDCYVLLSNVPVKIVTALRSEDVERLPDDLGRVRTLKVLYTTRFGEPIVEIGVSGPVFTMS